MARYPGTIFRGSPSRRALLWFLHPGDAPQTSERPRQGFRLPCRGPLLGRPGWRREVASDACPLQYRGPMLATCSVSMKPQPLAFVRRSRRAASCPPWLRFRALEQLERAEAAGRRAGRGELGHVALGYGTPAVVSGVLSAAIRAYRAQRSDVTLHLAELESPKQLTAIIESRQDVGFTRSCNDYPADVSAHRPHGR